MKATAHDVGMGMIRQRGTTTGEPEFIAAYLAEECRRDRNLGLTAAQRLDRVFAEHSRALGQAFAELSRALGQAFAPLNAAMRVIATARMDHDLAQRDFVLAADTGRELPEDGPP